MPSIALLGLIVPPTLFAGQTTVVEVRTGVPRFTLEQAILTALQRNPDIQRARQEIERTKGIFLEFARTSFRASTRLAVYQNTDPQLGTVSSGDGGGLSAVPGQLHDLTLKPGRLSSRAAA